MKRRPQAQKPKDAEWPLLTISEELLAAAEKLRDAKMNLRNYLVQGAADPFIEMEFAAPRGREQGLEALQLIEAGAPVWLGWVIRDHLDSIKKTRCKIVATPWMFTGEEIYDTKSIVMKLAQNRTGSRLFCTKIMLASMKTTAG